MMRYGSAYYPEHWPEERWPEDARLMRAAGFNVVRLGEFAWCRMEPQRATFDFAWLDRAIDVLNGQGIAVVIGTPTAGPPPWLVVPRGDQPDCRQIYENGAPMQVGARSLCCVNHPFFVERSRHIARALGEHYAGHPGVIGYQLDNELGMFGVRCYCPYCVAAFRDWLRAKYSTLDALNSRLGMIFGGNEFSRWDEIPVPHRHQDLHNPGLLLDSQRFFAASNTAYLRVQAEALRAAGVSVPITTNVCHMYHDGDGLDCRALFEPLDLVGWDCYPVQFGLNPPIATLGLLHTIARGIKGKRYWMLEQQSGAPMEWFADDVRRIRLWVWQSVAHGAELVLFFRWRTGRFGGEQYWRGILDHDGVPNERYRVVAQTGQEIARLAHLIERLERPNEVAILLDYDANQSLALNWYGEKPSYRGHAEVFYEAARKLGHGVDVVYDGDTLDHYRVVILPLLCLIDERLADRLHAFVERGGTLIASPLTATLNRDHVALPVRTPAFLQDLFGVARIEWGSLVAVARPPKELATQGRAAADGKAHSAVRLVSEPDAPLQHAYGVHTWYDQLELSTAQVVARFATSLPLDGAPALTHNRFGAGQAWYIAAFAEQPLYDDLLRVVLGEHLTSVRPADPDAPLELVPCTDASGVPLIFALNHTPSPQRLVVAGVWRELIADHDIEHEFELPGYAVALLQGAAR
jgi:beta-galactosidase